MFRKLLLLCIALWMSAAGYKYTNALIDEESPYLRQHAHNPVDWLPWGKEAFAKAKKENKLIFLSIGYSTCHWCHVMEKESFENEEIAALINRYYIPIKVDKEERPDLDRYYQSVYALMHRRSGGWPLTIIMTPDGLPFYSATYIPPEDGYGVEGMKTLLPKLASLYHEHPQMVRRRALAVVRLVDRYLHARFSPVKLDTALSKRALDELQKSFDSKYGGFGKEVKFPQVPTLDLLCDIYLVTNNPQALRMVTKTLDAMANGGIFDQIEGAFFRYSTSRDWSMPHFEKMLYTNAQLVHIYTRAYFLTGKQLYKRITLRTIKEIDRRFGYKGLYMSASDADTNGTEGGYFLMRYDDALAYLQKHGIAKNAAKEALRNLSITPYGNFDTEWSVPIKKAKVDPKIIALLAKMRQKRSYPFIDNKILTSWNAMYIASKLEASFIEPRLGNEAIASLDALIARMYPNHTLYHQTLTIGTPKKAALLEDYAYLIHALVQGYETNFDTHYLELAMQLLRQAKKRFYKEKTWYLGKGVPADLEDRNYASALAILYHDMLDLALLRQDYDLFRFAKQCIAAKSALIAHDPASYPTATRAAMRIALGDVVIKGRGMARLRCDIAKIRYPYVRAKEENISGFMACKIDLCFASSHDFAAIKKAIERRLHPKPVRKWHGR